MKAKLLPCEMQKLIQEYREDLSFGEDYFSRLDRLYSKFLFYQNDLVRTLHRWGELTEDERDDAWRDVDLQEREWERRLVEWREAKFYFLRRLWTIQSQLREASCVAA